MRAPERTTGVRPRLHAHELACARPHGLQAGVAYLRRRSAHRLRGELEVAELVVQGLGLGCDVCIAHLYLDPGFVWLITIGDDAIVVGGTVVCRDVDAGTVVFGSAAEEHGTTVRHTADHPVQLGRPPRYAEAALATPEGRARALSDLEEGPGYVG